VARGVLLHARQLAAHAHHAHLGGTHRRPERSRQRVDGAGLGQLLGTAETIATTTQQVHGAVAALRQGEPVELTGTEFELLVLLSREPGRVFSRDDILNHIRGHEADLYTRAVDIVVSRLRKKLEPLDCIKTLRNAGYTFAGARL